jgi:acyl carrier protein
MDEKQATDLVIRLVARARGIDPRTITPRTDLVNDLGFDSLDASELLASVHTETGAHVPLANVSDLRTVEDVARALSKQEQEVAR